MTPSARIQSAIEVLDGVIAAARGGGASADRLLGDWFRTRRFIGSKDRRAIRELVYGAIRRCGEVPVSGRAAMLRMAQGDAAFAALFDGSKYGRAPGRCTTIHTRLRSGRHLPGCRMRRSPRTGRMPRLIAMTPSRSCYTARTPGGVRTNDGAALYHGWRVRALA